MQLGATLNSGAKLERSRSRHNTGIHNEIAGRERRKSVSGQPIVYMSE
jgi:hypothetical protein